MGDPDAGADKIALVPGEEERINIKLPEEPTQLGLPTAPKVVVTPAGNVAVPPLDDKFMLPNVFAPVSVKVVKLFTVRPMPNIPLTKFTPPPAKVGLAPLKVMFEAALPILTVRPVVVLVSQTVPVPVNVGATTLVGNEIVRVLELLDRKLPN